jgi:hypothetical protein
MKDLKQLWVIKIDPSKLKEIPGTGIFMNDEAVTVRQLGHYISDSNGHYGRSRSQDQESMKSIMNEIETITSDDLKNAKALFRFPHLNLSRDKVKILQEKFDLKLKRDFHQADYGIVSEKYFDKLFAHQYLAKIDIADVRAWADVYKDCMEPGVEDTINARLDIIPEDAHVVRECDWFSSYHYEGYANNDRYSKMIESIRQTGKSNYHYYIESLDQWNNIQDNISKLVWDSNINDLATEDSEILTEEMYVQLKTMLGWHKTESGCGWEGNRDKENMNVALAMIANCNIKESHTYLALLFAFLSDSMKDAGIWNSVNFKSVRKKFQKYIDMNGWNWCHAYNWIIEQLIKDNALTEYAWKEIATKMYDDVLSSQYGIDSKNSFSISPESIQLKPHLKEKMKIEEPVLDDLKALEDMVDMHTESHDYAR